MEQLAEFFYQKESTINFNNYCVADTNFNGPLLYYKYKLRAKNETLNIIQPKEIKSNSTVITMDESIKKYIEEKYEYEVKETYFEVIVYNIKNERRVPEPSG